jgi:hypothetical protein
MRFRSTLLALLATLACSDSQGPSLRGPPFLKIIVDGQTLSPRVAQSGCGDFSFILSVAPLDPPIPDADVLEIRLAGLGSSGTFRLGDPASGSFARAYTLRPAGLGYQTSDAHPGQVVISGLSFQDSLVSGSFAFELFNLLPSSTSYTVRGWPDLHRRSSRGHDLPGQLRQVGRVRSSRC